MEVTVKNEKFLLLHLQDKLKKQTITLHINYFFILIIKLNFY